MWYIFYIEIMKRTDVPTSNIVGYVMHTLASEETIPGLPPGGGLNAK